MAAFAKGINYWSFPGGLEGTKPVRDAFIEAAALGYDVVEVCLSPTGDVSLETTEASAKAILADAKAAGVRVSSVACGMFWEKSLSANDPGVRAEALEIAKQLIRVASWLEVDAVLLIPGAVDVFFLPDAEVIDYSVVHQRATEAVRALLPLAEECGVALAIENVWNKFLVGPGEMAAFIDQFDSEWVGSYFDVGNCMLTGYPEQWIRALGKRIKRVHVKDFRRAVGTVEGFVDLLEGDVDWPAVLTALDEIGYTGPLVAEMIPHYKLHPEVRIANTARALDAIVGG